VLTPAEDSRGHALATAQSTSFYTSDSRLLIFDVQSYLACSSATPLHTWVDHDSSATGGPCNWKNLHGQEHAYIRLLCR
jgi:hypothetical protein